MVFTGHGHYIPGTDGPKHSMMGNASDCGGLDLCPRCRAEAEEHRAIMLGEDIDFQTRAKAMLREYLRSQEFTDAPSEPYSIYVVWFAKTLQNWKAMLGTTRDDAMLYELTHDGDKNKTHFQGYHKVFSITIPD